MQKETGIPSLVKALIIFCKYPEPGKVKTRLGKEIGFTQAASLYATLLQENLSCLTKQPVRFRLFLFYDPNTPLEQYRTWLGDYLFAPQQGTDLGERMYQAFLRLFAQGFQQVLLVGSDIPGLHHSLMTQAFAVLEQQEVVLGPAADGGYYLIGFRDQVHLPLFTSISWSTSTVLQQTLERLHDAHLSYGLIESKRDIDTLADLLSFPQYQAFWPS
jgi:hypothetical protein